MSDELTAENELICEKLLGWEWDTLEDGSRVLYRSSDATYPDVPAFTTWADAGLILDALREKALVTMTQLRDGVPQRCTIVTGWSVEDEGLHKGFGASTALAIRAAALAYIRSLP